MRANPATRRRWIRQAIACCLLFIAWVALAILLTDQLVSLTAR